MSKAAMMTLTQDFLQQDKSESFYKMLIENNIYPFAFFNVKFTSDKFYKIFGKTSVLKFNKKHIYLSDEFFQLGPCLVVFCRGKDVEIFNQSNINTIKGNSEWNNRSDENLLRSISGFADKSVSFIHAPDTLEEAIYESNLHLGTKVTKQIFDNDKSFEIISSDIFSYYAKNTSNVKDKHPLDVIRRLILTFISFLRGRSFLFDNSSNINQILNFYFSQFSNVTFNRELPINLAWHLGIPKLNELYNILPDGKEKKILQKIIFISTPDQVNIFMTNNLIDDFRNNLIYLSKLDCHRLRCLSAYYGEKE